MMVMMSRERLEPDRKRISQHDLSYLLSSLQVMSDQSTYLVLTYQYCTYCRFNYKRISQWMGDTSKTVYITMIRDPVDIFVSAWDYYKQGGSYKMTIGKVGGSLTGQSS